MEYEFIHDAITGQARAKFSLEHEVIGPWLEVELSNSREKLTNLLTAIDDVVHQPTEEITITGHEYSVTFSGHDVEVYANSAIEDEELPDMLTTEHIHPDQNESACCGIEDFRTLLLSWARFTNNI
ncbi:MAG: YacL family protein [Colwellia sp.]